MHILFFVSCLRLEIANHTAVLDAAVLPLTDRLMPRIDPFLAALTNMGFYNIKVDDDELRLWKELLPALVDAALRTIALPNVSVLIGKSKAGFGKDGCRLWRRLESIQSFHSIH
jgi:hypothetical protein